jgi:predicted acylesterase/phospholipase RssA
MDELGRLNMWMVKFLVPLIAILVFAQGCSIPNRLAAVPQDLTIKATIPGMTEIRFWMDADQGAILQLAREAILREKKFLARAGHRGPLPPATALAVSGGGDNGAFGAGLLVGWSATGNRPTFKLVTGVSTGALIAPFAFLGPEYDKGLKSVYTEISAKDIFNKRSMFAALFDDAMADTQPLWRLVARHVDAEMLRAIAKEYQNGRLLVVATTNLDALRPVMWNMGAIAESGHPKALDLFRTILVASAAIPGAFPPVMIEVEAGGQRFQEMHVDGGAMAQVFVYPPSYRGDEKIRRARKKKTLYIIRNARLDVNWATVERRTLSIAGRAISSLIHTQGIGDLYQIYLLSKRDDFDFNLAFIPPAFKVKHKEQFDPNYMRKLFDYGYQLARKGYPWQKFPPGYAHEPVP